MPIARNISVMILCHPKLFSTERPTGFPLGKIFRAKSFREITTIALIHFSHQCNKHPSLFPMDFVVVVVVVVGSAIKYGPGGRRVGSRLAHRICRLGNRQSCVYLVFSARRFIFAQGYEAALFSSLTFAWWTDTTSLPM